MIIVNIPLNEFGNVPKSIEQMNKCIMPIRFSIVRFQTIYIDESNLANDCRREHFDGGGQQQMNQAKSIVFTCSYVCIIYCGVSNKSV